MSRFTGRQDFTGPKTVTDKDGRVVSKRQNKGVMAAFRSSKREDARQRQLSATTRGCGHHHTDAGAEYCRPVATR